LRNKKYKYICGNWFIKSLAEERYLWHICDMKKSILKNKLLQMCQSWLVRFNSIINRYLDDNKLNNQKLAIAIEMSERNLFRKVKEFTGLSPKKYLRKYRLHHAMEFLKQGKYKTVKSAAAAVGFVSTSYFIGQFEKEFGVKPLKVLRESGWR